jgi:UDP-N-acetylmuramoyl-tripeptide--D-alanyl-D-alanine ligase
MARLDPDEAATIAHGRWVEERPSSPLTSFAFDTRRIQPGETFVALKSDRADGHEFLGKALEYRANAALVERHDPEVHLPQLLVRDSLDALQALASSWRERFKAPVIGVTGSYGKTTVKEMLGIVMGGQWFRTRGNYNNHIGVPLSLLELDPGRHAGAILEAGINDRDEMDLLAGMIRPDMAIVTAVGPAHLERLGSVEGVACEKAVLARAVKPGGCVFISAQLLQYDAFRSISPAVQIHALARKGEALDPSWGDLPNVTIYHYDWTESTHSRGMGVLGIEPPMLPGDYSFRAGSPGMVSNLALVVHVALHLGVPSPTLQACLDAWRPFRQRGEVIRYQDCHYYVDCYNANPGSMLDSARRFNSLFPDEPHLYVVGSMKEMGEESERWHRETGAKLPVRPGSTVYLVGAEARPMADGLASRGVAGTSIHLLDSHEGLKERLSAFKGAVFIKGSRSLGLESLVPEGGRRC